MGELARSVDTLVIMMGLRNLSKITKGLLAGGCEPDRPAALIQSGTRKDQKTSIGTVATLVTLAKIANFRSPTIVVIGQVANFARETPWFPEFVWSTSSLSAKVAAGRLINLSGAN